MNENVFDKLSFWVLVKLILKCLLMISVPSVVCFKGPSKCRGMSIVEIYDYYNYVQSYTLKLLTSSLTSHVRVSKSFAQQM
jgi:hypothetical protein